MTPEELIETTATKIGLNNFLAELDALGWRGLDPANVQESMMRGHDNCTESEKTDRTELITGDMEYILHMYGYDLVNNVIVDIVPR